jgi:hypothetical protein
MKWYREEIGVLTSLPLLRKVVEDLEDARTSGESALRLYFTKESHIHTLVNLVLYSGLPIANRRIPELDYCVSWHCLSAIPIPLLLTTKHAMASHISRKFSALPQIHVGLMKALRFELYERNGGREKSDKEYSIKLSLSEGAHSSNVLDSAVDARHSLNVQPRRYEACLLR